MAQVRTYTPKEGYTVIVRRGRDDIKLLEMGILRLAAGASYRSTTEEDELAIILLAGWPTFRRARHASRARGAAPTSSAGAPQPPMFPWGAA